ncbi:MAG TPA: serine hydrolase [Pyrinomonadaceae bacterium]|jgi:CubicO group peptidase (beta-lactamase class C family)
MKSRLSLVVALALVFNALLSDTFAQDIKRAAATQTLTDAQRLTRLESQLESLRQELKIPALSAAIVKNQKVVWARGFGFADVEAKIPANEHTPYHLASLTKTFASTIVMQLVQEGKVKLDDPVSKYGITLESDGVIRVRHLLSHTSEGNPGEQYRYSGNRFAELDKVIRKASGKSFAELLIANILDPLGMNESAPNVPPATTFRSPNDADRKAEDEVRAALTSFVEGFNAGNVDQIERFLAPQQNGFQPEGGFLSAFLNTAELRGAYRSGFKIIFQVHNLETAVYGNTAVSTFIIKGDIAQADGGTRIEGPWRTSFVWNRQDGAWKLVHAHQSPLNADIVTEQQRARFDIVAKTLAKPYRLNNASQIERHTYPTHFSTSAGLMASVLDMAKYDIAIDQNKFLNKETQQLAFTPAVSTRGESLPYGLGWFTQNYRGVKLIWHYGYWTSNSSLIIKVPERNLTFIAMANTDNLSRPTDLGSGDVMSSPVGLAFLKTFVLPELLGEAVPEINWNAPSAELEQQLKLARGKSYGELFTQQLLNQARINSSVGRNDEATRLFAVFAAAYAKSMPAELSKKPVIAQISRVVDDKNEMVEFNLPREQRVRIFAIGEGDGGQMYDYGWIENVETTKTVWEMKLSETNHAGGARKNRGVDTVVNLPAGKYKLHYKSDNSHSFERWNSLPPEVNFWGIALYAN